MGLNNELPDTDGRSFLLEFPQDIYEFVIDAHGQIGRKPGAQSDALQFCILFSFGTFLVGFPFAVGHTVDGIQDIAQCLVLAHQGVTTGDEDVA